jgi:hypothetical protein
MLKNSIQISNRQAAGKKVRNTENKKVRRKKEF